jgi:hypothetical protein
MESSRETLSGWALIDDIRATMQGLEPQTEADQELYAEGLDQVEQLADARRMRLVAAEEGLPTVLWVVLVSGGMAVVAFTYFYGLENIWAHTLMVVWLAGGSPWCCSRSTLWSIPSPVVLVLTQAPSS